MTGDERLTRRVQPGRAEASPDRDYTVQVTVEGLTPGHLLRARVGRPQVRSAVAALGGAGRRHDAWAGSVTPGQDGPRLGSSRRATEWRSPSTASVAALIGNEASLGSGRHCGIVGVGA